MWWMIMDTKYIYLIFVTHSHMFNANIMLISNSLVSTSASNRYYRIIDNRGFESSHSSPSFRE